MSEENVTYVSQRWGQRAPDNRRSGKSRRSESPGEGLALESGVVEKRSGADRREDERRKDWTDWTSEWTSVLKRKS